MAERPAVIEVQGLTVSVTLRSGQTALAVDDVSFRIDPGGSLGLVGESGSGKTMTSLALMRLLPAAASVDSGTIVLDGIDILGLDERQMTRIRGRIISMVLQDPMTALDPSFTIRSQLGEPLRQHRGLRGAKLTQAIVAALDRVHLPSSTERMRQYPHQLSGGMRQRVTSAIALAGEPSVLIADEPTTALDVTTQARYLQLLRELQQSTGFALILVAHDLMVVRHVCDDVIVMYASQVVEQGPTSAVFDAPEHPYTMALLGSIPVLGEVVELRSIDGQAPDISETRVGCSFAPRCEFAREVCRRETPALTPRGGDRSARCWGTEADGWIKE